MSSPHSADGKVRVLLADHSVLMRKYVGDTLESDGNFSVVARLATGARIAERIAELRPDILVLDGEVAGHDAPALVRELRDAHPRLKIILCPANAARDLAVPGVTDVAPKPLAPPSVQDCIEWTKQILAPKLKAPAHRAERPPIPPTVPAPAAEPASAKTRKPKLLCIGASTGGPNALVEVFQSFTGPCSVPIVIVQHMPPGFTLSLAERLNRLNCGIKFAEGAEGTIVEPGHAYIAPGGLHMEVRPKQGRAVLHLHDGPPEHSCRPAVDVLFRSVETAFRGDVLAVILTGMGADGCAGCEGLAARGALVLAQDEASSVVWGMPGAVTRAGVADEVLPLSEIGPRIQELLKTTANAVRPRLQVA